MNSKNLTGVILLGLLVPPAFAQPTMTLVKGGVQSGNWVWEVDITPDLVLAGGSTPMAIELGFRLTGAPLVSVTNINPSQWDYNNPGSTIFGWEVLYGPPPLKAEGIEGNFLGAVAGTTVVNPATSGGHAATGVSGTANEIFAAMGSINFTTPGPKPFLKVITQGPGSGFNSSTIQWLGAYGVGSNKGRMAQGVGTTTQNFDIYAGTDTQAVPEAASIALIGLGAVTGMLAIGRRRSAHVI